MLTSKQRAYLKKLANPIDPIFQVGKSGVTPDVTKAIADALEAREIIKINVLKNCIEHPKDIAEKLAERTQSNIVQVIGRKIILYKESKENPKIQL
ncbi:RNA-binding protein [Natranaerovirga hydrolytica]|uniref:RNA-binding protein n=1 Tax=Natranaerovirga hydrolytica TaxID=680378 RepID=A0A4R1MY57_9FIRM|nr:RNA-binding protein [Natranaerovirga hydrolytica]